MKPTLFLKTSLLLPGLLLAATLSAQLPIDRVAAIRYQVHDLAQARAFYTGLLGFPEAFELQRSGHQGNVVFFRVNDDQYLQFVDGGKEEGFALGELQLLTHDLRGLHKGLRHLGLSPTEPVVALDGGLHMQLKDTMGNTLDFLEYRKQSKQKTRHTSSSAEKISDHLLHVGLAQDDSPSAFALYKDKLGFREFLRGGPNGEEHPYWINMNLPVSSPDYIELMVNPDQPALGRDHLCLEVPDIHKAYEFLLRHHVPGQYKPFVAQNHRWIMNLRDPYGIRIEIMGEATNEPMANPPKK